MATAKKATPKKAKMPAKRTTTRATAAKKPQLSKYEQAGAPWWKRTPLPQPKH